LFFIHHRHLTSVLFPYTTLFRSPLSVDIVTAISSILSASSSKSCKTIRGVRSLSLSKRFSFNDFIFNTPLFNIRRCAAATEWMRSEEHTSELQSRFDLVCRLLLE